MFGYFTPERRFRSEESVKFIATAEAAEDMFIDPAKNCLFKAGLATHEADQHLLLSAEDLHRDLPVEVTIPCGNSRTSSGGTEGPSVTASTLQSSTITTTTRRSLTVSRIESFRSGYSHPFKSVTGYDYCWGLGEESLVCPEGLSLTEKGDVIVADPGQHCLLVMDSQGFLRRKIQQDKLTRILGDWKLKPQCVSSDSHGQIWLTDQQDKCVRIFSEQGMSMGSFSEESSEYLLSEAFCPYGLAITQSADVILTHCNDVISIHEPTGRCKLEIREQGNFWYLALDDHGRLFASDCDGHTVKVFDQNGQHLLTIGGKGCKDGYLHYPHGVCIDNTGHVIVADSLNNRISRFSQDGRFVENIVSGKKQCHWPRALSADRAGHVVYTWNKANLSAIKINRNYQSSHDSTGGDFSVSNETSDI